VTRAGVFLDRDGTLNVEIDFLRTPEELELIPGAARAVRTLNELRLPTCVISNQSGVARGYLTEAGLVPIHARLQEELAREGAHIDRIYYCPHHPTEGVAPYNVDCDCRKPKPGMILQGARELGIDPARSYVVGDRLGDMQAGRTVGATTVLVLTGYGMQGREECRRLGVPVDRVAADIVEAVDFIAAHYGGRANRE
jgi:D-glycero-D-manno-heptose 1,7-bisphosphate phosphatase